MILDYITLYITYYVKCYISIVINNLAKEATFASKVNWLSSMHKYYIKKCLNLPSYFGQNY